ncbi:MAG: Holliday junction branch migration protein RuvA [Treponema sp.]|nr:Holliday junction branch migration protein RuvA [Treponema sp.]
MFNSIQGVITKKSADALFILTGGVEWDLIVPATDNAVLPDAGENGRVLTWLYHREDGMRLFGFCSETRRNTFLELLKVDGIGPKGAVKIMGGISQEELENALDSEDIGRLEKVPGLGKKTAQKMLLALKGRLSHAPEAHESVSPYADLVEALAAMGFDKRSVADVIAKRSAALPPELNAAEKERELFKQAIQELSVK